MTNPESTSPTTSTTEATLQPTNVYSIPGAKVLLIGDSGAGKTDVIATLLECGIDPFLIFTEPGMATLGKSCRRRGIDIDKFHWTYIAQAAQGWGAMISMAKNVNSLSYESLTKMSDSNRKQHTQIINLMTVCNNYVCDRTGESFGDVADWGTNRCLVIDSLSGMNEMAMSLVVGDRPTRSPSDWQVAQNTLWGILKKLTNDLKCHLVITGHLSREKNELTGGVETMVSTLGRALAPQLPKQFDDVVCAVRDGDKFSWSTTRANTALKGRNLPWADGLTPSFIPLIETWKENGGVITSTAAEVKDYDSDHKSPSEHHSQ